MLYATFTGIKQELGIIRVIYRNVVYYHVICCNEAPYYSIYDGIRKYTIILYSII